jgi:hypothetical protein
MHEKNIAIGNTTKVALLAANIMLRNMVIVKKIFIPGIHLQNPEKKR